MQAGMFLARCKYLCVRTDLTHAVAGFVVAMNDAETGIPDRLAGRDAIELLIGGVGRDDAVIVIDNDKRSVVALNQGLQVDSGGGCRLVCHGVSPAGMSPGANHQPTAGISPM